MITLKKKHKHTRLLRHRLVTFTMKQQTENIGCEIEVVRTVLRGAILNRTYGEYKSLYISLVVLSIFDAIYYGPP